MPLSPAYRCRLGAACLALLVAVVGVAPTALRAAEDDFAAGGAAYRSGDKEEAFRIWSALAERGEAAAQFNIGRMHATGDGTAPDMVEAYKWLLIASRRGRVDALTALKRLGPSMDQEQRHEAIRRADAWRRARGG